MNDGLGDSAAKVLAQLLAAKDDFGFLQGGDGSESLAFNDERFRLQRYVAEFELQLGGDRSGYFDGKASVSVADAKSFEHILAW